MHDRKHLFCYGVLLYMNRYLPKAALTCLLACSLVLGGLTQPNEATWTLDESPKKRVVVQPKPLLDVPKPLRDLLPFIGELERSVAFGKERGDVKALLRAVKDLAQAGQLTGVKNIPSVSDTLLDEATELAWEQRDSEGLRDALILWSSPDRAGRNPGKIRETSERLEQVENEKKEMLKKKRCSIVFHNRTDGPVKVYVNRKPVGTLASGERHVVGELLAGRQYLDAMDSSLQWGPRKVYVGPGEVFNWRLFD